MPRCYMVKKGAPCENTDPVRCSHAEANAAPPTYQPPDESRDDTETGQNADAAVEYAELRSAPISERSAADTEAAHDLLSLAAGVPPLAPATLLTVMEPPIQPIVPVFTYTLQPATIYFVSENPPEPVYQRILPPPPPLLPMPRFVDRPNVNYIGYPDTLPPMPPLTYHPPQPQLQPSLQTVLIEREPVIQSGTLTTLTIEEITTDSEPDEMTIYEPDQMSTDGSEQTTMYDPDQMAIYESDQISAYGSVDEQASQQVPVEMHLVDEPLLIDDDSNDGVLKIINVKEKVRFDCKDCGKTYATSSNLSRHKQTHRSLDSNSAKRCEECGKVYVSMPALAMHVLTHRMGHVCGVCGKLFSRPWLLRGHVRSHTGEKPYNCADCGKSFADRSNLRAHLQTHSSDKKYECPRCKKIFALKSYLNKHMEAACTRGDGEVAAA